MKRSAAIFLFLSLAVFAVAGGLWHRSLHYADYYYRLEPAGGGSALRGFGSYKGALVFGSVQDSSPTDAASDYRHDTYLLTNGSSMLKPRPVYRVSGLGFGVSQGELTWNLPLAFMLPTRLYHVVYVPYYFIMLLTAIYPARYFWRLMMSSEIVIVCSVRATNT